MGSLLLVAPMIKPLMPFIPTFESCERDSRPSEELASPARRSHDP